MNMPYYTATTTDGETYDYASQSLKLAMRAHNAVYPQLSNQVTQWEHSPSGTVWKCHDSNL